MELKFNGANCLTLSTKGANFVIDDNLKELGRNTVSNADSIRIYTSKPKETGEGFFIDSPGEYEIKGLSIFGVPARAHTDEEGGHSATIYKLVSDDFSVAILGHVFPSLDDEQLEALGTVDVLVVPVGGSGYTLDSTGAIKLIRKIEPKVVVPTHFADPKLKFPVPQQELEVFAKEIGIEVEKLDALKAKDIDLGEKLRVVQLNVA